MQSILQSYLSRLPPHLRLHYLVFIIDPYTSRDCLQLHFAAAYVDSVKSPHFAYDFNFDCWFFFFFNFDCSFFFARSLRAPANLSPGAFGGTANPLFASKWNQKLFLVSICALPNRLIKSCREKEAAAAAEQAQHKEKEAAAAAAEQALSEADTKNTNTNTNTKQRQNNESATRCAHSLHSPLSLSLSLLRLLGLQIFVLLTATATASKSTSTTTTTATPTPTAASQLGRISFLKTLRHEAAI